MTSRRSSSAARTATDSKAAAQTSNPIVKFVVAVCSRIGVARVVQKPVEPRDAFLPYFALSASDNVMKTLLPFSL